MHRAFNRQSLARRTAIVAAGPLANLLLAVLLYACAHWIGIEEPKAVLGSPAAGSLFERAGVRAGDWVRGYADGDDSWNDLASINELNWQVIRHALNQQPLQLQVTDAQGRGQRTSDARSRPRWRRARSMPTRCARSGCPARFASR